MAMPYAPPPPPPPAAPVTQFCGPVAVVHPVYCVDYNVDLTITQKVVTLSDGDYSIKDINGNVIFRVHGKVLSLRGRRTLIDANGNTVLNMRGKLFSIHGKWQVFRGESEDPRDLLFSVKKSSLLQFKTNLDVFLAANTSKRACDFRVKGNRRERSVTIYLGDTNGIIAQMREQYGMKSSFIGQDVFGVTVYPKVDYAFVAALIVILDDLDKSENKKH